MCDLVSWVKIFIQSSLVFLKEWVAMKPKHSLSITETVTRNDYMTAPILYIDKKDLRRGMMQKTMKKYAAVFKDHPLTVLRPKWRESRMDLCLAFIRLNHQKNIAYNNIYHKPKLRGLQQEVNSWKTCTMDLFRCIVKEMSTQNHI